MKRLLGELVVDLICLICGIVVFTIFLGLCMIAAYASMKIVAIFTNSVILITIAGICGYFLVVVVTVILSLIGAKKYNQKNSQEDTRE